MVVNSCCINNEYRSRIGRPTGSNLRWRISMNYLSIYNNILNEGKKRNPFPGSHKHHIIPKHLNGTDTSENLVYLVRQEHRIIHAIRFKLWKNKADAIATVALGGSNPGGYKHNQSTIEKIRVKAIGRVAWNKGKPNEVARQRMLNNNPMKDPKVVKKSQSKGGCWVKGNKPWNQIAHPTVIAPSSPAPA
jgi:hypothetical protein